MWLVAKKGVLSIVDWEDRFYSYGTVMSNILYLPVLVAWFLWEVTGFSPKLAHDLTIMATIAGIPTFMIVSLMGGLSVVSDDRGDHNRWVDAAALGVYGTLSGWTVFKSNGY